MLQATIPKQMEASGTSKSLATNPKVYTGLSMNLMDEVENAVLASMSNKKDAEESKVLLDRLFSLSTLGLRRRESEGNVLADLFPSALFDNEYSSDYFTNGNIKDYDDIVLYPIVGFKWVKNDNRDLKMQVLPFSTTQVSMPVMLAQQRNEEIYGWFRPASCDNEDV